MEQIEQNTSNRNVLVWFQGCLTRALMDELTERRSRDITGGDRILLSLLGIGPCFHSEKVSMLGYMIKRKPGGRQN